MVHLKKGGRDVGVINLGPGCFITVGDAPKVPKGPELRAG